jgi:hypothetical protein
MELRYALHGMPLADLRTEVNRLWNQLITGSELRMHAEQAGIDVSGIQTMSAAEAFTIKRDSSGLDPATTAVIVSLSPVAAKILLDVWQKIILPRIQKDKGQLLSDLEK